MTRGSQSEFQGKDQENIWLFRSNSPKGHRTETHKRGKAAPLKHHWHRFVLHGLSTRDNRVTEVKYATRPFPRTAKAVRRGGTEYELTAQFPAEIAKQGASLNKEHGGSNV